MKTLAECAWLLCVSHQPGPGHLAAGPHPTMQAEDAEIEDPIFNEPKLWEDDVAVPEVEVRTTRKTNGANRLPSAIAKDKQRISQKLVRQERTRVAQLIPVRASANGKRGGVHAESQAWTPDEDAALLTLLPLNTERPCWVEITRRLAEVTGRSVEGGNARTQKSVRNRWLRMRTGRRAIVAPTQFGLKEAKNFCRVCGQKRAGHVCPGPSAKEKPVPVNDLLIAIHDEANVAKASPSAAAAVEDSDSDDDQ